MRVAIIGGGASGLACAVECARKAEKKKENISVTVYEAGERVGKKILVTGNGRCNMMNENENVPYFGDDKFTRYALDRFNVKSNLSFFASMGLYTKTDSEGRIYPLSNQASGVLDALRFECERLGVSFECSKKITAIKRNGSAYDLGEGIKADRVVLACGGKAGVKGYEGYEILKNLNHQVVKPCPALTKLNVADNKYVKQLKGIRHKGKLLLYIDGKAVASQYGEIQFTDYGLSGIAVMQLSSYITRNESAKAEIVVDTVPDFGFSELCSAIENIISHNPTLRNENLLTGFMPKKIGEIILKSCNISLSAEVGRLDRKQTEAITSKAKKLTFDISGVRGFEDAQVTSGGADTREFNPMTMESKKHKGLYCIGEMLNIDGLCGGYNLMWAWSSGRLCGENLI